MCDRRLAQMEAKRVGIGKFVAHGEGAILFRNLDIDRDGAWLVLSPSFDLLQSIRIGFDLLQYLPNQIH